MKCWPNNVLPFLEPKLEDILSLNVWCNKIRTKDCSKTLLSLERFLMHQPLLHVKFCSNFFCLFWSQNCRTSYPLSHMKCYPNSLPFLEPSLHLRTSYLFLVPTYEFLPNFLVFLEPKLEDLKHMTTQGLLEFYMDGTVKNTFINFII